MESILHFPSRDREKMDRVDGEKPGINISKRKAPTSKKKPISFALLLLVLENGRVREDPQRD